MQEQIVISTDKHDGLYDITEQVAQIVRKNNIRHGLVNIYVQGATAGIMIQENWDDSVQNDVVTLLNKLIPSGVWQHDAQDNNGDSHLKAGFGGAVGKRSRNGWSIGIINMAKYIFVRI